MHGETTPLSFAVLPGPVRRERMGLRAARLAMDPLQVRGREAGWVDPMVLPLLDRMYVECT
ncbi:MAG: hypothetical protein KGJ63_05205 [Pseudomonadota bacterium]|nr:hypothetical protein [Pseudomonadota bacterium]